MSPEELLFAAQLSQALPTVDLHKASDLCDAVNLLESFLYRCSQAKERYGRVIHGLGKGALAKAVDDFLANHPLVTIWEREGHGGSCVVVF